MSPLLASTAVGLQSCVNSIREAQIRQEATESIEQVCRGQSAEETAKQSPTWIVLDPVPFGAGLPVTWMYWALPLYHVRFTALDQGGQRHVPKDGCFTIAPQHRLPFFQPGRHPTRSTKLDNKRRKTRETTNHATNGRKDKAKRARDPTRHPSCAAGRHMKRRHKTSEMKTAKYFQNDQRHWDGKQMNWMQQTLEASKWDNKAKPPGDPPGIFWIYTPTASRKIAKGTRENEIMTWSLSLKSSQ